MGRNILEIISLINGQLVCLHGFTFLEIMFEYIPKWKLISSKTPVQKDTLGKIKEIEERINGLIIGKIIDKGEEQQIFAVQLVSKNYTRQEKKTQAKWTKLQVEDMVLVHNFERDKHNGQKLDLQWVGLRILTEITPSRVLGFVQKLYDKEVKKYHLDNLKTYCP